MKQVTTTVKYVCDRCFHEDKDGRDLRKHEDKSEDTAGFLDITWEGLSTYRDTLGFLVDSTDRGAAWLCQDCRSDFLMFMNNVGLQG